MSSATRLPRQASNDGPPPTPNVLQVLTEVASNGNVILQFQTTLNIDVRTLLNARSVQALVEGRTDPRRLLAQHLLVQMRQMTLSDVMACLQTEQLHGVIDEDLPAGEADLVDAAQAACEARGVYFSEVPASAGLGTDRWRWGQSLSMAGLASQQGQLRVEAGRHLAVLDAMQALGITADEVRAQLHELQAQREAQPAAANTYSRETSR